ncbi:MAG: DUF6695 family protein [Flavobacteriales bacterium]
MNKHLVKNTMVAPGKPNDLPKNAQWLAGEGAGSWFCIKSTSILNTFSISRFSSEGKLECNGKFSCGTSSNFNINQPYVFTHLSHCKTVNIIQSGIIFKFERL